jgi:hypothetical protein
MNDYFEPFEFLTNTFLFFKNKTSLSIEKRTLVIKSFSNWAGVFNYRYQDYFSYAGIPIDQFVETNNSLDINDAISIVIESYHQFGTDDEKLYLLLNLSLLVIPSLTGKPLSRLYSGDCMDSLELLQKNTNIERALDDLNKRVIEYLVLIFAADIDQLDLIGVETELSDRRIKKLLHICKPVQKYLSVKCKQDYYFYALNNHIYDSRYLGIVKQGVLNRYLEIENPNEDQIESIKVIRHIMKERKKFNEEAVNLINIVENYGLADELEKSVFVLNMVVENPSLSMEVGNKVIQSQNEDWEKNKQVLTSPSEIKCYLEHYVDEFIKTYKTNHC